MARVEETSTDLSEAQIAFKVAEGDVDQFLVSSYRGTEGLCQLYRFEIELISREEQFAFEDVVGKAAVLSIRNEDGTYKYFHGLINRFEITGESPDQTYYRAELVPNVWLLTQRYNSRIFQGMTTPDILSDVLDKAGIAADRIDTELLTREYPTREYCVQYRETDYNFICRLMEEEGIRWYFTQSEEAHLFVLADTPPEYPQMEGEQALSYTPVTGMVTSGDHIWRFRIGQAVRPGAVVLNDYNFENPALQLEANGDSGRDAGLVFADYPGKYTEQSVGGEIAQLRAEEFEASRIRAVGESACPRLGPGHTFDLTEHPTELFNDKYLVTSITHQGRQSVTGTTTGSNGRGSLLDARVRQSLIAARQSEDETIRQLAEALLQIASKLKPGDPTANRALTQWLYHGGRVSTDLASIAGALGRSPVEGLSLPNLIEDIIGTGGLSDESPVYQCRFECMPATVPYRPARVTPWPVVRGSQTARVVGPENEEIYTDEYGRVKVQFNWDREGKFDEKSSCWIRVAHGAAGIAFLPRIGQEVLIEFLEGDPDKPIVSGRLCNTDTMPPRSLPAEKTKSVIKSLTTPDGGGFNEFSFEDKKDEEHIFLYGQKDLHVRILNDERYFAGNDKHVTATRDQKAKIGRDEHRVIEQDSMLQVKRDRSVTVDGKDSTSVGDSYSLTVGGDMAESVGGKHSLEVSQKSTIKAQEVVIDAMTGVTLKCGSNFIKVDMTGVSVVGTMTKINSGGAAGSPEIVSAVSPAAPVEPEEPLSGDPEENPEYEQDKAPWHNESEETTLEWTEGEGEEKTWIGVRLMDQNGEPMPGERYRVTLADGTTIAQGRLNNEGEKEIRGIDPGQCQITFPDLDAETWQAGAPPGGEGGAADSGQLPDVGSGSGGMPGLGDVL